VAKPEVDVQNVHAQSRSFQYSRTTATSEPNTTFRHQHFIALLRAAFLLQLLNDYSIRIEGLLGLCRRDSRRKDVICQQTATVSLIAAEPTQPRLFSFYVCYPEKEGEDFLTLALCLPFFQHQDYY